MATPLDTALIDQYTAGMNVPLATQAGYPCTILVRGSGARAVTLGAAPYVGYATSGAAAGGNGGPGGFPGGGPTRLRSQASRTYTQGDGGPGGDAIVMVTASA
jgi:hypothetical protein